MRSEHGHERPRAETPRRLEGGLDKLKEAGPASAEAWERTTESAAALGGELRGFNVKFDQVEKSLAEQVASGEITSEQQATILAQVKAEETKLLAKYFDPTEKAEFDRAQAAIAMEKTGVRALQGEVQAAKDEVTVQRLKRTGALIGGAAAGALEVPAALMEKGVAPLIGKSRPALRELTSATAETIDKLAPSVAQAIETGIKKAGFAAVDMGGRALLLTAEGAGKLVEYVGRGVLEVSLKTIEHVPAAVGKGVVKFFKAIAAAMKEK